MTCPKCGCRMFYDRLVGWVCSGCGYRGGIAPLGGLYV